MDLSAPLYNLTQELQGALYQAAYPRYLARQSEAERPTPHPLFQIRRGLAENPAWVMTQVAKFYPEALTVALFRQRVVYSAPGLVFALLELLASEQWLDRRGDAYHLRAEGQAVLARMMRYRIEPFTDFAPIPQTEIALLARLMRRVIDASLARHPLTDTWCLAHSRRRAPDASAAELAHIIQYASDFNAFRDDAHMAAQRAHNIDGHTWEGFAYIHDGRASDATSLYQQLAYRGYAIEDWQTALTALVERGWLAASDQGYIVTPQGSAIHEQVERLTDHYFYAPWAYLDDEEQEKLITLLQRLYTACHTLSA